MQHSHVAQESPVLAQQWLDLFAISECCSGRGSACLGIWETSWGMALLVLYHMGACLLLAMNPWSYKPTVWSA